MIPAGIERDKRIAELRGECIHMPDQDSFNPHSSTATCFLCAEEFDALMVYELHSEDVIFTNVNQKYSTDIAAAMELWNEIREALRNGSEMKPRLYLESGTIWVACEMWDVRPDKMRHKHLAETEADAISGCYLKWRESEHGQA